ncbi:hypothetical protein GN956_G6365 [Arapaima gigas]
MRDTGRNRWEKHRAPSLRQDKPSRDEGRNDPPPDLFREALAAERKKQEALCEDHAAILSSEAEGRTRLLSQSDACASQALNSAVFLRFRDARLVYASLLRTGSTHHRMPAAAHLSGAPSSSLRPSPKFTSVATFKIKDAAKIFELVPFLRAASRPPAEVSLQVKGPPEDVEQSDSF